MCSYNCFRLYLQYNVALLFAICKLAELGQLAIFQQNKRRDKHVMAMSYTHLP